MIDKINDYLDDELKNIDFHVEACLNKIDYIIETDRKMIDSEENKDNLNRLFKYFDSQYKFTCSNLISIIDKEEEFFSDYISKDISSDEILKDIKICYEKAWEIVEQLNSNENRKDELNNKKQKFLSILIEKDKEKFKEYKKGFYNKFCEDTRNLTTAYFISKLTFDLVKKASKEYPDTIYFKEHSFNEAVKSYILYHFDMLDEAKAAYDQAHQYGIFGHYNYDLKKAEASGHKESYNDTVKFIGLMNKLAKKLNKPQIKDNPDNIY